MPLNNYGFNRQFGWVNDRFGVSWQLNLNKSRRNPKFVEQLMNGPGRENLPAVQEVL
jgi:predicted 3-demethylubiquinone-9 3-methyltransferase (glyoxalase superfamily)